MNLLDVNPFLRILLPFAAGISIWLSGYHDSPQFALTAAVYCACVAVWLTTVRKARTLSKLAIGLLTQTFLLLFGWGLCSFHYERNKPAHVSAFISSEPEYYSGYIGDLPAERTKTIKSVVILQHVKVKGAWRETHGRVLVYFQKQDRAKQLQAGDKIVFAGMLKEVLPARNPDEFDYRNYLELKNIFHDVYLRENTWNTVPADPEFSLYTLSQQVRKYLLDVYKESGLQHGEFAMVAALVLGYDDEIDKSLMTAYSHTGTMHILSVSGLHVGLIYLILGYFFVFLDKKRSLRWLRVALMLIILWFFVLMSGFSAPAVRAALMFTLILIGKTLFENVEVSNIVFVSAFLSLCYNPYWLADVGFQLSYAAVLGIIYLYPRFYQLFTFSSVFAEKLWALCSVSIAAQIATLPLTLYYFHQLPVFFLITNLILIPASTLIMYGGILILIFSKVALISKALVWLTGLTIQLMNAIALFFDDLPFCVVDNINLSLTNTVFMYLLIFTSYHAFDQRSYRWLRAGLLFAVAMTATSIVYSLNNSDKAELVIYHSDKTAALALVSGNRFFQLSDTVPDERLASAIRENMIRNDCVAREAKALPGTCLIYAGSKKILYSRDGALVSHALMQHVQPHLVWLPASAIKRKKQRRRLGTIGNLLVSGKLFRIYKELSHAYFTQENGAFVLSLHK